MIKARLGLNNKDHRNDFTGKSKGDNATTAGNGTFVINATTAGNDPFVNNPTSAGNGTFVDNGKRGGGGGRGEKRYFKISNGGLKQCTRDDEKRWRFSVAVEWECRRMTEINGEGGSGNRRSIAMTERGSVGKVKTEDGRCRNSMASDTKGSNNASETGGRSLESEIRAFRRVKSARNTEPKAKKSEDGKISRQPLQPPEIKIANIKKR